MRRSVVLLLALLVACGAGTASADSGIEGTATYGPTCPVEQAGAPPCVRPYSGVIVISRGDKAVASVRSGADGRFRIALAPGAYTIGSTGTGLPFAKPLDVVVRAHAFTNVTVMFDSGIR
jgi:hypothetical protein